MIMNAGSYMKGYEEGYARCEMQLTQEQYNKGYAAGYEKGCSKDNRCKIIERRIEGAQAFILAMLGFTIGYFTSILAGLL